MTPLRLLVCGGRDFSDRAKVREVLGRFLGLNVILAHGGAMGADRLAGEAAVDFGWDVQVFQADWTKHGKAAANPQPPDAARIPA